MTPLPRWLPAILAPSALLVGCVDSLETPSAYDAQRDLCSAEHADAWRAAVDSCKSESDCGGVVSFTGELEGGPVTVESTRQSTVFRRVHLSERDEEVLDRVDSDGSSPYFTFSFRLASVGGGAGQASAERPLVIDDGANGVSDRLDDDLVMLELYLQSASEDATLRALDGGSVIIATQSEDEVSGTFTAAFGDSEDPLEGCFHLLATAVTTSEE